MCVLRAVEREERYMEFARTWCLGKGPLVKVLGQPLANKSVT